MNNVIQKLPNSFTDVLGRLQDYCVGKNEITVKEIFSILAGRGYPALLIVLALPFCVPVQIPGFSTPFGFVLMFLGFRMVFWKRLWWPKWVLEKKVSTAFILTITQKVSTSFRWLQQFFHPRFLFITNNVVLKRCNGLVVCILAFILALPLPIPMTNLLTAFPIVCIGIGLLEKDGLMIMIGYGIALIWLILIFNAFFFSQALISGIFR